MATYSIGLQLDASFTNIPICEIRSQPTVYTFVTEIGFVLQSTVTGVLTVGVGRPAAQGINPLEFFTALGDDQSSPNSQIMVATSWGTAPITPVNFFRRASISVATTPVPFIFRFPRGIGLAASSSLVVWCISSPGYITGDLWVVGDVGQG